MSRFNSPIPRTGLPTFHESSGLRSPRDSDATARQHIRSKTISKQMDFVIEGLVKVTRDLNKIKKATSGSDEVSEIFFPFKIMASPSNPDPLADPDESWRTFRVHAGAVGTIPVKNTDGADIDPDDTSYDEPAYLTIIADPDFGLDFVVASNTLKFYVWVDCTDIGLPFIDTGTTPPGGGTEASFWIGTFILLAIINTQTKLSTKETIIRQYRRADIAIVSGCAEDGSGTTMPI